MHRHVKWLLVVCVTVLGAGTLLLHAWRFYPFINDDALISLRYTDRLLDGAGLTWNDGERVEGYSNLLWILLTALAGLAGLDLVLALRILGPLFSCLTIVTIVVALGRRGERDLPPLLFGTLFVSFSGPMAIWAIGGLEQPLVGFLLALGCVLLAPLLKRIDEEAPSRFVAPGVCFGLLGVTRPDGLLFGGLATVAILPFRPVSQRPLTQSCCFLLPTVVPFLAQAVLRLAYYGDIVPNSARVKLAADPERVRMGLEYLRNGAVHLWPLIGLASAVVVLWFIERERRRAGLFVLLSLGWTAYLVFIGGDIFAGHRHFVPLIVLAAIAVSMGSPLVDRRSWRVRLPIYLAVAGLLVVHFWLQFRSDANRLAIEERWEFEGEALGRVLNEAFIESRPLITVDAAGSLGYYSRLPAIDMLGLCDRHIARERPGDFGKGFIGHELGDGKYVLEREPDIVIFHTGRPVPYWRGDAQLYEMPQFRERYERIWIGGREPVEYEGVVWVRTESPKIGIERGEEEVVVPAMFFARKRALIARNGDDGRLVVGMRRPGPVLSREISLGCGTWSASADAGEMPVELYAGDRTGASWQGIGDLEFGSTREAVFKIAMRPARNEAGFLRELRIVRLAGCDVP